MGKTAHACECDVIFSSTVIATYSSFFNGIMSGIIGIDQNSLIECMPKAAFQALNLSIKRSRLFPSNLKSDKKYYKQGKLLKVIYEILKIPCSVKEVSRVGCIESVLESFPTLILRYMVSQIYSILMLSLYVSKPEQRNKRI